MRDVDAGPLTQNSVLLSVPPAKLFPVASVASLCVLTFLAYAGTLRFLFVHDDRGQILGNPAVHSWHAVPSYFISQVWAAVGPANGGNDYRPIFLLWLRINDAIFGQHAFGWHLTTILAHVAATYCVFLLAHRILGDRRAAIIGGLVFGLHPIHIEGVAWISGVPEPLMSAFAISAFLCWIRHREQDDGDRRWLGASLALYAMAILTKETAVVLVLILFVAEWMEFPRPLLSRRQPTKQAFMRALIGLMPFIVLTVVYFLVRILALKGFSHPAAQLSWLAIVLTWPSLLLFYVRLLLWPVGLSPFYDLHYVTHPTIGNTVLPALVLSFVALGLWKWASRSRPVALAIPWLVIPILPVLNVQVFGDGNFAHNRYLYLPSVGLALLVAAAWRAIKLAGQGRESIRMVQNGVFIILVLLMGFTIQVEDRYYASDATFYAYAYSRMKNPDPIIGMDHANTLAEAGDYDSAAKIYQQLIRAHPEMWDAYFNLGYMEYQQGKLDLAAASLSQAAAGNPANAGALFYLGLTNLKRNRMDAAELNLRRAVALAPASPNFHFALGMVLKLRGDRAGALAEFRRELEVNPGHPEAAHQAAEIQGPVVGK